MPVPRLHLFELEDQSWFPAILRDYATDYLHVMQRALKLEGVLFPLVERIVRSAGVREIVDLCSGGSGPVPALVERLQQSGLDVRATLTDLYPNTAAFEAIRAGSDGRIGFVGDAVDARAVPARLTGLRTMFNGFHHFAPLDAQAILTNAVNAGQPIAIFEVSERSARNILPVILVPIFVWLATPFMRPFPWRRLLWTYPVPLVPLTCFWDGVVSQWRAYTVPELRELGRQAGPFTWEAGQVPMAGGWTRLTYLMGLPKT
ncbi:MAG TPA: hypothetical protein VGL62_03855 [Vicinamibacterales bacterium]|jgi:hypothetical protein